MSPNSVGRGLLNSGLFLIPPSLAPLPSPSSPLFPVLFIVQVIEGNDASSVVVKVVLLFTVALLLMVVLVLMFTVVLLWFFVLVCFLLMLLLLI